MLKIRFQGTVTMLVILILLSCSKQKDIAETVNSYFQTYQERVDFERFIVHYDKNIEFEDIVSGVKITGVEELGKFFDWSNPDFKKLDKKSLIIQEKIISDNQAVVKGYFTPFKWKETKYEAMHFTTILTFNKYGKIIKHVDWINYPNNLLDYQTRGNSNSWIK